MKKILLFLFLISTFISAQQTNLITLDGVKEAAWGQPVAYGDNIAVYDNVNLKELYITFDANFVYIGAVAENLTNDHSFQILINTGEGGSSGNVYSYSVEFQHEDLPDLLLDGRLENNGGEYYGEIHRAYGDNEWSYPPLGSTDYFRSYWSPENTFIEIAVSKTKFYSVYEADFQFCICGDEYEYSYKGIIEAIPDEPFQNNWLSSGVNSVAKNYVTNVTLPVELTSFAATTLKDKIILNWHTVTETNNNGFDIQRSYDNSTFTSIGFVQGNGTTTTPVSYSYIDETPGVGKVYYRLKQVDYDGSYEYSNVVTVETGTPDSYSLSQNYPNPFNPGTTISYALPESANVKLIVYDMLGREVATLVNETKEAGKYSVNFDASNLASGIYIYRLQAGNFTKTNKMTLLK